MLTSKKEGKHLKSMFVKAHLLAVIILFLSGLKMQAQIFQLDSVLASYMRLHKFPETLIKDVKENNGRMPFIVSSEIITLFHLKDTIIDGLKVDFFSSKEELVRKYGLKKSSASFYIGFITLRDGSKDKIKLELLFSSIKCDKRLIGKGVLLIESNGYTSVEYFNTNLSKGSIVVTEIGL